MSESFELETSDQLSIREVSIKRLGLAPSVIHRSLKERHRLQGTFLCLRSPLVVTTYLGAEGISKLIGSVGRVRLTIAHQFCLSPFGRSFELVLYDARRQDIIGRAYLPLCDRLSGELKNGVLSVALCGNGSHISILEIDFRGSAVALVNLLESLNQAAAHRPYFECAELDYWYNLGSFYESHRSNFTFSPTEKLRIGWAGAYLQLVRTTRELFQTLLADDTNAWLSEVPGPLKEGLQKAMVDGCDLPSVVKQLEASVQLDSWMPQFYESWAPSGINNAVVLGFVSSLLRLVLYGDCLTLSGRRFPWLDSSEQMRVKFFTLEPNAFSDQVPIEDFWYLPSDRIPLDDGKVFSESAIRLNVADARDWLNKIVMQGESTGAIDTANHLLREASALRQWTIPPGAIVEISIGRFSSISLYELYDKVIFGLQTSDFQVLWGVLHPGSGAIKWHDPYMENEEDAKFVHQFSATILLVLSAVIRDFWVVEERERVFDSREERQPRQQAIAPITGVAARIIYLPRVKYLHPSLVCPERVLDGLELRARQAHFVSGHVRKVGNPSPEQLAIARLYNISVPEAHTFVRPHYKGAAQDQVVFRSRSALMLLEQVPVESANVKSTNNWFKFERDCKTVFERNGFEVIHFAASRSGDSGVDVIASRNANGGAQTWLVQCKCYSPHNLVGPNVIRELLGSLSLFGADAKGVVMTTSDFTRGARRLGEEEHVRLINGEQFHQLLGGECEVLNLLSDGSS